MRNCSPSKTMSEKPLPSRPPGTPDPNQPKPPLNLITNFSRNTSRKDVRKESNKESALSPSDGDLVIGISLSAQRSPNNLLTPAPPEIVVTPAVDEGSPWSKRRRPTSSWYSQATRHSAAPPVPPLPDRKSRVTSWGTDFEEDETPHEDAPRRASLDTIATRHRSKGWWNEITSPFINKTTFSPTSEDVRNMPRITRRSSDLEQRRTMAFFLDSPTLEKHQGEMVTSPEYVDAGGFGLAAEYFEACFHDQESSEPYFECQNHECIPNRPIGPFPTHLLDDETGYGTKGIIGAQVVGVGASRGIDGPEKKDSTPSRPRQMSDATEIEDDSEDDRESINDHESTPILRQAQAAPVVRAKSPLPPKDEPTTKPTDKALPPIIPVAATAHNPVSPEAMTPGLRRELASNNAMQLEDRRDIFRIDEPRAAPSPPRRTPAPADEPRAPPAPPIQPSMEERSTPRSLTAINEPRSVPVTPPVPLERRPNQAPQPTYIVNQYFGNNVDRSEAAKNPFFPPPPSSVKENKAGSEKVKANKDKKTSLFAKVTPCVGRKPKQRDPKRRKCLYVAICGGLLAIIILILVLVLTLTLKRTDIPTQSSWLNITGYPPVPTGISTIIRPDKSVEEKKCVFPTTMWSCAVPKEQQESISPNSPDQPNFRVEIRFQNGTSLTNSSSFTRRHVSNAVSAGSFIRRKLLHIRDSFTDSLFEPAPAPPSIDEQSFLGKTTDGISNLPEGEATPFFMSFLPSMQVGARLIKRQSGNNTFPNITDIIPPPSINADGTAAAANLLPYPSSQPLRLYNRGKANEHYGFYTYFDRSIFLKSVDLLNSTDPGEVPADQQGGSDETAATVRCTWAQTRFLVQIWTNTGKAVQVLAPANTTQSTTNSANDFARPGSFPYPVSITLDRHGGDPKKKMIYCYAMDRRQRIIIDQRKIQLENRSAGGKLVNPSKGVFGEDKPSKADGGPGGIDGGSGGCGCQWKNFKGA